MGMNIPWVGAICVGRLEGALLLLLAGLGIAALAKREDAEWGALLLLLDDGVLAGMDDDDDDVGMGAAATEGVNILAPDI